MVDVYLILKKLKLWQNFNIKHLRIVKPRCTWPNLKALATSVGAKDILRSAKIYETIERENFLPNHQKSIAYSDLNVKVSQYRYSPSPLNSAAVIIPAELTLPLKYESPSTLNLNICL